MKIQKSGSVTITKGAKEGCGYHVKGTKFFVKFDATVVAHGLNNKSQLFRHELINATISHFFDQRDVADLSAERMTRDCIKVLDRAIRGENRNIRIDSISLTLTPENKDGDVTFSEHVVFDSSQKLENAQTVSGPSSLEAA